MRQCHVLGLIKYELRSMIKGNGHYSVMGVYYPLDDSDRYLQGENSPRLMLPAIKHRINDSSACGSSTSRSATADQSLSTKRIRLGKGSNILPVVRKMLSDKENWKTVSDKRDYHFLGTFPEPSKQQLYYIPECSLLPQALISSITSFGRTFSYPRET